MVYLSSLVLLTPLLLPEIGGQEIDGPEGTGSNLKGNEQLTHLSLFPSSTLSFDAPPEAFVMIVGSYHNTEEDV